MGKWLAEAFEATGRQLEFDDLPLGGDDAPELLDRACKMVRRRDCVRCGDGQYTVTPRGCQLACVHSQLNVLMAR